MNRELDLGRLMQTVGRRMVEEGQVTSQRFHDWKRVDRIETDSNRGGGNGGSAFDPQERQIDRAGDRQAARMFAEWVTVRSQLEALTVRAGWLMDQAKGAANKALRRDWTPAQAEAEGWCGSHWRVGEEVPIGLRPTGEPWYAGRCRRCGSWPDGDPPLEVLKTWRDGKTLRVKAS